MSISSEAPHISTDRQGRETGQPPTQRLRLTADELRILEECNKESFLYRSMPLAAIAMVGTQLAVNKGFLKPHPRWGSALKVMGAGFLSWFVGKFSYQSACEEKFLRLKNSPVADMIRKKRGITTLPFDELSPGEETIFSSDPATSYFVDDDFTSNSRSLNLDTDKNIQYAGLDDSDRFRDEYSSQPENKPPKFTTYEELRRKNREDYEMRQSKLFAPPTSSYMAPLSSPSSEDWRSHEDKPPGSSQSSNQREHPSVLQNIYGGRWDK